MLQRLLVIAVLFSGASTAIAQVDRTGLNGTVTDPSGRVLPETHVAAVQSSTGLRRETTSSPSGTYDIPELPVGVYTVTFDHIGFESLSFDNVIQAVQQTRTLNATLQVSGGRERIEVSASSEQLDESSSALGGRIGQEQIKELSLNGRNWATLTALAPGAVDTGGSNQRSVRFAGRGRDDNNFTYDGIDATNIINQAQQPYVRLAIPLDTIQEFRADSMLATAETGGTGGGQMAATSPSGTNQFHGHAFEFFRNNVLDAREPIDALNPVQPPFHLNQFGGSLGGPIVRDKTFFFAAYESYRQILGQTLPGFVPSDSFRAQVAAKSPALIPILNAYPGGRTLISPDVEQFVSEGKQIVDENSGMLRLDHRFSPKTTAFARGNIDRAVSTAPFGSSGQYLEDRQQLTSAPVNAGVELLHIFSPAMLDEVKFGFNRSTAYTTTSSATGSVYAFTIPGFTSLNTNKVSTGVGNSFSGIDNMTWVKERHVVKAGVEIRRIQMNQGSTAGGSISFASLDAFAANQVSTASLTGAQPVNGLRKTQYFAYAQDEFKWLPNLTVNLGVRYSFFGIFHEAHGRADPFDFATCGPQGFCGVGASFGQPNYRDIDPRLALAWAPAAGGHTLIRAGFGNYHEDGQLDDQNLPVGNEVYRYSLSNKTVPALRFPIEPFLDGTVGKVSPRDDDRKRKDTVVTQWSLSVQRALPADFVATFSYIGSHGAHLLSLSEVNVVDPATGTRAYPQFGQVAWRGNKNNSDYAGFSVAAARSFSHGFLLSANYMWSHETDDGSNGSGDGDSLAPQNVACQSCERADGIWDVRHTFHADAVYQLPLGPGKRYFNGSSVLDRLAGSWELTSILVARTGFPVNVTIDRAASDVPNGDTDNQRPSRVPGVSLTPPGGSTIAEWINPSAFALPAPGTFGNAPRNLARGPGQWQADIGVEKRMTLREGLGLDFRAEFFNIFNHPQYGPPQTDLSAGPGVFGSVISSLNSGPVGTGTPRQIQFMLRVGF